MKKKKILVVGRTGSGKSTFADMLKKNGLKSIESYSTRKPRFEGEKGHIFINKDDLDKYKVNVIAWTMINGNEYFATLSQLEENDIYIVDPIGTYDLISRELGYDYILVYVYSSDEDRLEATNNRSLEDKLVSSNRNKDEEDQFSIFEQFIFHGKRVNENIPYDLLENQIKSIKLIENKYSENGYKDLEKEAKNLANFFLNKGL